MDSFFTLLKNIWMKMWKVRGKKNEQEKDKREKGQKQESWITYELKVTGEKKLESNLKFSVFILWLETMQVSAETL